MKMFGLIASGKYDWCDEIHTVVSKFIFTTKEKAELYIPTFKKKCVTPLDKLDLKYLVDDDALKICVVEFEVL